jgi:protocatechuate 3,4-dioxygenase beta subunit
LVAACGGSSGDSQASSRGTTTLPTSSGATSSGSTSGSTASSGSCSLAPEMTEGPFYLDLDLVRSDITEGRPGTPLALAFTVTDASCTPIQKAAVDIWHADAEGDYSGVQGSSGTTFLRGTQLTDARGRADFQTVYPGWYQGRAVHIHVKVHVGSSEVHTGQLFFPDDLTVTVYKQSPYAARGAPDMRNADDSIFADGGSASTVIPEASGSGYSGSMTLAVNAT